VVLRDDAIWAVVSDPNLEPCEVLLVGGTQAVKVDYETAKSLQEKLLLGAN